MTNVTPMAAALASGDSSKLHDAIADMERRMKSTALERRQLDDHISQLHRIRLEAYAEAKVYLDEDHESGRYQVAYDRGAQCRFESFDSEGDILYTGYKHFRGEVDTFESHECVPLPASALGLPSEQAQAYFATHAAKLRQAREAAEEEAGRVADAELQARERSEYERLHAKFGQPAAVASGG